jgi:hypothetical protein
MRPQRSTIPGNDGKPKLYRDYLFGSGKTFGVFVHHFVGSDAPTQFHDHPWSWGLSVVLGGGYVEERLRRDDSTITRRWLKPGRFNLLLPGTFHRVELREGRAAWTLFVHGPKIRKWGFLDSATGTFRLWRAA